jgi:hypothetical protein
VFGGPEFGGWAFVSGWHRPQLIIQTSVVFEQQFSFVLS